MDRATRRSRRLGALSPSLGAGHLSQLVDQVSRVPLEVPENGQYCVEWHHDGVHVFARAGIESVEVGEGVHVLERDTRWVLGFESARLRKFFVHKKPLDERPRLPSLEDLEDRTIVHPSLQTFDAIRSRVQNHRWYRPIAVEVEITNICNLRCEGCSIIEDIERGEDGQSSEQIVSHLEQFANEGCVAFSMSGGEPFMRLDKMCEIVDGTSLDPFKVQTNGKVFTSKTRADEVLGRLLEAGFGAKNKYFKPSINVSLGMQTEAGASVESVACLLAAVPRIFGTKVNLQVNVLSDSDLTERATMHALESAYRAETGCELPVFPLLVTNRQVFWHTPRLAASGLIDVGTKPLAERVAELGPCPNFGFATMPSPASRTLLRADGTIYPCAGFAHEGSPGSASEVSIPELLDSIDKNRNLACMAKNGLSGLIEAAPHMRTRPIPKKMGICQICALLRQEIPDDVARSR